MNKQVRSSWTPKHKKTAAIVAVLIALIGLRVAAPYVIQWYVNRVLDQDPNYDGHVGDVDLYLYLGMYTIEDVSIVATDGEAPVPLFDCKEVQLSVQWGALLDGAIVGEIDLIDPVLNIAVTAGGDMQDGGQADWREIVLDLFPVSINRFGLHNGEIHYLDIYAEPNVDLWVHSVNAEARNLTNSTSQTGSMVADFDGTGVVMGSGNLTVEGELDPYSELPTFNVVVAMRDLELTEINPWLDAYVNFDVNEGTADAYAEVRSVDGEYQGYLKPLLRNVDVFDGSDLREDGPLRIAWEGVVGLVKGLFSNESQEQIATVAPIEGSFDAPGVDVSRTIWKAVVNAFISAIQPGFIGVEAEGFERSADAALGTLEGPGGELTARARAKIAEAETEAEEERAAAREAYAEDIAEADAEEDSDKAAEKRQEAEEELAEELRQADEELDKQRAKWRERSAEELGDADSQ